jgi:hypothetical protein
LEKLRTIYEAKKAEVESITAPTLRPPQIVIEHIGSRYVLKAVCYDDDADMLDWHEN